MLLMSTLTLPNDTIIGNAGVSYKQHPPEGEWDAIAIGSGIGGLASAVLLAQRAGKRVLVLERHYTAGGFTHVFHRPGYEWDVGVHYIGEMGAGEPMRALFDEITEGRLKWNAMPEVYDRIRIADRSYDFVSGAERYAERMREYFPREGAAIGRYVAQVHDAARASRLFFAEKAIPAALARVAGPLMRRRFLSYARRTTAETLARLTGNGELIAVLTGHWGNYGLPPGQSSFGMHAVIAEHYLGRILSGGRRIAHRRQYRAGDRARERPDPGGRRGPANPAGRAEPGDWRPHGGWPRVAGAPDPERRGSLEHVRQAAAAGRAGARAVARGNRMHSEFDGPSEPLRRAASRRRRAGIRRYQPVDLSRRRSRREPSALCGRSAAAFSRPVHFVPFGQGPRIRAAPPWARHHRSGDAGALRLVRALGGHALEAARRGLRRAEAETRGAHAHRIGAARASGAREDRLLRTFDAALAMPPRQYPPGPSPWTRPDAGALSGARAGPADAGPQSLSGGRGRSRAGSHRRVGGRGAGGVGGAAAERAGGPLGPSYAWKLASVLSFY